MPIDLAAAAARFAAAFTAQLRSVTLAQRMITVALTRRTVAVRAADLATTGMPIVRFTGGAVSLHLVPGQRGVLTPAAPAPGFGAQVEAGAQAFLTGIAGIAAPLRAGSQETAVPRLVGALATAAAGVEASVRRFAVPGPRMFDADARTASDLFGLAALAFRALAEGATAGGQLRALTDQVRRARAVLVTGAASQPAGGSSDGAPETPPPRPLAESLDALSFTTLGVVAVAGVLPELVGRLVEAVTHRIRQEAIDELGGLERLVLDLRRDAFQAVFVGLGGTAERGLHVVAGAHEVIAGSIGSTLRFWQAFGTAFLGGVRDFVLNLAHYLRDWVTLMAALPGWLQALTRFDLVDVSVLPAFALDDLLDSAGHHVNLPLQARLDTTLDIAETALAATVMQSGVPLEVVGPALAKIQTARRLVRELFRGGGVGSALPPFPEAAPLRFDSRFPLLGGTLFAGARRASLLGMVDRLERDIRTGVGNGLARLGTGMDEMAAGFAADAARSARFGAGRGLERVRDHAAAAAAGVFGDEVAAQRAAAARQPGDRVADAFEAALVERARARAEGAVLVLSTVVERYVGGMAAHWRARITTGTELTAPLTPTSPRLLRKRARLGRVVLPRLTLNVAGPLDDALADAVVARFVRAVQDAHRAGEQRLAEIGSG